MQEYVGQVKPDELLFSFNSNAASDAEVLRELQRAKQTGENMTGYCSKAMADGTLVVELSNNILGYIPREEVTYRIEENGKVHMGKCMSRVGLNVQFKVLDVKTVDGKVAAILSRKKTVEEVKEKLKKELKSGMIVSGVVTAVENWGAYIDIGGDITGMLPLRNITKVYIRHPSEALRIGQAVDVVVTEIENTSDGDIRAIFSREELLLDYDQLDKRYRVNETVVGRVKLIIDTGIFVELDESFEGLADFVPNRHFKYGDKVRVKIVYINKEKKRIRLRIVS